MSELDRIFADIAVLEAVINAATPAQLSGLLSIDEWLQRYRPRDAEGSRRLR